MNDLNNRNYYLDRAECERRIAAKAIDPYIGAIHATMAERYDRLLAEMRDQEMPVMRTSATWLSR